MEIYMPMVVLFRNFIDLNFRASDLQSRGVNLYGGGSLRKIVDPVLNHSDSTYDDDDRCISFRFVLCGEFWRINVDESRFRLTDSDVTHLGYCKYVYMMMKIGSFRVGIKWM
ncbi:hypothetical protein MtrunA17_Chr5g0403961 [Medicago truncatula]|uniref:Uncharacterized protein n=1 Tax=Medicago truncatula TaxID=3880 RepID=A0A396HS08_MEDTR|nr:hypothetical protein MtrunA17_Chr5g0403961 [Medicago truncatula]